MKSRLSTAIVTALLVTGACSGGSSDQPTQGTNLTQGCDGHCMDSGAHLTAADVAQIIAQGVAEASARGAMATIAVVDRSGNVLGVYRMGQPSARAVLVATAVDASRAPIVAGGLEGIDLPAPGVPANIDQLATIAKAVTGAYLSSEGNAFSTRTASQIIQQHFDPGELMQASGPLFGVQFSQLACSDFVVAGPTTTTGPGPQRSPLGLSADPGGFPLYKSGTVVGGVGVLADGLYSIDPSFPGTDQSLDELIATAASYGFAAPIDRRADQITVNGRLLRFSDVDVTNLASNPPGAAPLSSLSASTGALIAVSGYSDGVLRAGTAFGSPASGVRSDGGLDFAGSDAFVFVNAANTPLYRPRAGTDGASVGASALSQAEVQAILSNGLAVTSRARAQIRQPSGTTARVTIAVVDTRGAVLGMVASRDAPVFGADVALQKARTAMFFSDSGAAAFLGSVPAAQYLSTTTGMLALTAQPPLSSYAAAFQAFLADRLALSDGAIAYSTRAIGNLARPFYPDGIDGSPNGPLSKPAGHWSVFSTGLQLDVDNNAILQHVLFAAGAGTPDVAPGNCAGVGPLQLSPFSAPATASDRRLGNGPQIFPGGVPIYRGGMLVGGVGVSGDGVDQDDMVAFLGLHQAAVALGTGFDNAPAARRADTVAPLGVRLRYVECPQAPFVGSDSQQPCNGL
jgi:uncharacterized protein GlcG (DUF336 family)